MSTVDIAMATYNGEKYISEQIDSIINQNYQNWKLYISDDGSMDDTVKIIKNFVSKDNRIELVNTERQGGVIQNFNKALEHTDAEFIVLSDQDDLWPKNRLEMLVTKISNHSGKNQPRLIFTDLTLINETGEIIAESFYKENSLNPLQNVERYNLLWNSTVYGCTTIMNRALLDMVLPIPTNAHMHDQWLAMKAHQNKGLVFFDVPTVLYRQHSENVVGGNKKNIFQKVRDSKSNSKAILKSVKKTKQYLKEYEGLYFSNRAFNSSKDFMKFATFEILPCAVKNNQKAKSLFFLIGFLLIR